MKQTPFTGTTWSKLAEGYLYSLYLSDFRVRISFSAEISMCLYNTPSYLTGSVTQSMIHAVGLTFPKSTQISDIQNTSCPRVWIRNLLKKAVQVEHFLSTQHLLPRILRQCLTSVWRMAARCSLAVSDSLSTSMCCLQSEFWLLRVSSFVCKARSSDSFFESSCFSWSICKRTKLQEIRSHRYYSLFENY